MKTKYFVDTDGNYIAGFGGLEDGSKPAEFPNAIEVPYAPDDARDKWNGSDYTPHVKTDEETESENLSNMGNDFKKTILKCMKEINQSDSNIFSAQTKTEILALVNQLRS